MEDRLLIRFQTRIIDPVLKNKNQINSVTFKTSLFFTVE